MLWLIHAVQLRKTIERLLAQAGAERPEKAKFFRGQMQTIISKALQETGIKPVPSRRCFTVICELGRCAFGVCVGH